MIPITKKTLLVLFPLLVAYTNAILSSTKRNSQQFAVSYQDNNYYYVLDNITNKDPGIDYICISYEYYVCCISSYMEPDGYGRIPKAYAQPLVLNSLYCPLDN